MIDPSTIDPSGLPSVPLTDRSQLPSEPCIYFAIDSQGVVQYIGRSINPKQRWMVHHRCPQLSSMDGVRVAYLLVDADLLPVVETALIKWFNPPLNSQRIVRAPVPLEQVLTKASKRRRGSEAPNFGDWLKWRRSTLGISQGDVAAALGVTRQAISKWEQNQSPPLLNPSQTNTLIGMLEVDSATLARAFQGEVEVNEG